MTMLKQISFVILCNIAINLSGDVDFSSSGQISIAPLKYSVKFAAITAKEGSATAKIGAQSARNERNLQVTMSEN